MIAKSLVSSLLTHGCSRMLMKPSMMICPVSVPVIVEAWPDAISATPKRMGASVVPKIG